jgi:molybdopterin-guanine dinucleotide biosynthesis protein A
MNYLSAVLLAGGESRRMGRDKATLTYKDRPLWQNQLDLLRKLQPAELFISARSDPAWRPVEVTFVPDVPPSRGPVSGVAAALGRMSGTHLLTLAVDMPLMTEACLHCLWEKAESGCGVLPMIGGRAEPLAAIYPADVLSSFTRVLAGNDFALQSLNAELVRMNKMAVIPIRPEENRLFWNMNELSDLL